MSSLADYRADLEALLSTVDLSGFFTEAIKNEFINRAGRRVYNAKKWAWLEHAVKTQSKAGIEYYAQPSRFKKGSIHRITLGEGMAELEYDVVAWNLYKQNKEQTTGARVASILGNQYFMYPAPERANEVIGIYGQLKWVDLTSDSTESINPEAYDEAIIRLALADALKKERRFSEANSETKEVTDVLIPSLWSEDQKQDPKGYIGQSRSTRW